MSPVEQRILPFLSDNENGFTLTFSALPTIKGLVPTAR